jgi:hypothetical protein
MHKDANSNEPCRQNECGACTATRGTLEGRSGSSDSALLAKVPTLHSHHHGVVLIRVRSANSSQVMLLRLLEGHEVVGLFGQRLRIAHRLLGQQNFHL